MTPEQPRSSKPRARREYTYSVRVTGDEKAAIEAGARKSYLSVAAWLRMLGLTAHERKESTR